jgi:hypothetical protein
MTANLTGLKASVNKSGGEKNCLRAQNFESLRK